MIVQCESCQKKYRLDDKKMPPKGTKVRCSRCKHIFHVSPAQSETPQPKSDRTIENKSSEQVPKSPIKKEIKNLPAFADWDEDIIVVTLPGDTLDAGNCQEFKAAILCILETPNKVIFNMENIQFVDSSGCGTLNASIKRIKKHGGDIKICNVLDQVGAIFRLIKLNRVFHICNTREEAIQAFDRGG
ncbi:MAG: anti-sigma B factor antagonist [Candidatus Magnetoglobus multicellularis str. Araruama]|uniref:Anti-sigma factor antagonist n=1 Tax=Candidatus Magnetoglobus multicellularis str. Araruama TaxID=890399 RepID=A0A1V1PHY8_9BACT|nr:MAG: anti-sigma B factor antagonist [Candidatus Magnetoglobus multicellularis str. Araruama]